MRINNKHIPIPAIIVPVTAVPFTIPLTAAEAMLMGLSSTTPGSTLRVPASFSPKE